MSQWRRRLVKIPFNKPFIVGKELYYIAQSVLSGHTAGDGEFTRKCQDLLEERLGAKKVLLVHSCTAALEMAAMLTGVEPGDEVIMPSFTFVSTANAFYMRGARIVFVDIREDTLNLDEDKAASALTKRSKAIVPVHYAGVGCEMDTIMKAAGRAGAFVVEDAAQALDSTYKGRFLGAIGDLGALSFHETKNFIMGEGGALVINNESLIERAEIIREKGTDRNKFFRGEVDKYTWVDVGSSYPPSDMLAAFLYAQLEQMEQILSRREEIFKRYYEALKPLSDAGLVRLPVISDGCRCNNHMFYILLDDERTRDSLMKYLQSRGILAIFHYQPLHLSKVGRSIGYSDGDLPMTEAISGRILRLPFYYELTASEQDEVVDRIVEFFGSPKAG